MVTHAFITECLATNLSITCEDSLELAGMQPARVCAGGNEVGVLQCCTCTSALVSRSCVEPGEPSQQPIGTRSADAISHPLVLGENLHGLRGGHHAPVPDQPGGFWSTDPEACVVLCVRRPD